jgi:hypothetical protein
MMAFMTGYVVGATRVVERPWPSGATDTEVETRDVPEGMVHAVDPETGQAVCGSGERLIVLDTPWEETWRMTYVGGPERCGRCVVLSMGDETRQQVIGQVESYLAGPAAGDERQSLFWNELLRHLRDPAGG